MFTFFSKKFRCDPPFLNHYFLPSDKSKISECSSVTTFSPHCLHQMQKPITSCRILPPPFAYRLTGIPSLFCTISRPLLHAIASSIENDFDVCLFIITITSHLQPDTLLTPVILVRGIFKAFSTLF